MRHETTVHGAPKRMRSSRERINAAALVLGAAFAFGLLAVWVATELMGPNRRIAPEKVPATWESPR